MTTPPHVSRRACIVALLLALTAGTAAAAVPPGFQDTVVFSGLDSPTAVEFAPDGRVFVIEKGGKVKVFDGLSDPTPTLLIDLSTNVHDMFDRGLLGLAVHPGFPAQPYIYVVYTYDYDPATPQYPAPRWGDVCPNPPGATGDGCVATGRVSRLQISPTNTVVGGEQVLLENNWCIQSVTHTIGDLAFDPHGALLIGGGDGAQYNFVDYGQSGGSPGSPVPRNPCGDPPGGRGGAMTSPTAEGGALRAQDLRTPADPLSWDGTLLRVDPFTGAAWPDNPLIGGNADDDRVIAFGLRNPFRFAVRPGTHEIWLGDVGWDDWEEINRIVDPEDPLVENFGWPCYEGSPRQSAYDAANLNLCESLYSAGPSAVVVPYFAYRHGQSVTPGNDGCNTGSSSISGIAFYPSGSYPPSYDGALFWADYGRGCIYVMPRGANGQPDPAQRQVFLTGDVPAVDLELGPQGDLFYANIATGQIRRISYAAGNTPPTAVAQATPQSGPVPLIVQFSGSASSDPDPGTTLTYAWDLDGDGQYDDATGAAPQRTYTAAGAVTVRLRVDDGDGGTDTDAVVVQPGNSSPAATIVSPPPDLQWRVGDSIAFSGGGSDAEDVTIPPSRMRWDVILHHCPGGTTECHSHVAQTYDGVAGGTFTAPDHDWYAYLEFRLRVTDSGGLAAEAARTSQPEAVTYHFDTVPSGLELVVGTVSEATPFDRPAIIGSTLTMSAELSQSLGGVPHRWLSWSNGGPVTQNLVVSPVAQSFTANYVSDRILVVAAHPDDDVLVAAGVVGRAVQDGAQVRIAYLTNGDLTGGTAAGLARQGEAVNAQAVLGMAESDLVFLGYPDGSLQTLVTSYPGPGDQFVTPAGQSVTYGQRGLGGSDYHTYRFGSPAPYNGYNLVHDLADLLDQFRPSHVVTLNEWDAYSDHAVAYATVVEALGLVHAQDPTYEPTLHSTIIWADPPAQTPAWPAPANPSADFTEVPDLAATTLAWSDRESLQVPLNMQLTSLPSNVKWLAIDAHASQGGAAAFLGTFVHKDEFFWVQNVLGPNQPPVPDAGPDQVAGNGVLVTLDGSASRDPENQPLGYRWIQVAGPPVTLSSPTAAQPTFVTPLSGVGQVLAFELRVSDGTSESLADSVTTRVLGAVNIAPLATATASSQTLATGQTAAKAIDGVVSGYPADPTREWATDGGGAGSWIELTWGRPYCVERFALYDRPNANDRVQGGTLTLSDATTLPVAALENGGGGDSYPFADTVVTSVRLTINQVSATTENVGLAEFEAYRCIEADFDGDDWLVSEGDCDDGDALRNPARTEVIHNGRDDDCDPATLDDDFDRDGYGHLFDCDDQNPLVHRIPAENGGVRVDRNGEAARITWYSQSASAGPGTVYDVITGSLAELVGSGGFAAAQCLVPQLAAALHDDGRAGPPTDDGYYYLVRATNACGQGTFGNARAALDATPPCAP